MIRQTRLLLWRILALVALLMGLIGIVVPVMPTAPFILVSAWAASRGWPALERWLLMHRHFGPSIYAWRERGAIPRTAKWMASTMMVASAVGLFVTGVTPWAAWAGVVTMAGVALWLWRRPD